MDFQKIPLESVFPSPMNPRKTFDEEAIKELAANIEKQGLIQPITVRMTQDNPNRYEIVCGERRYRAFKLLKEKEDALNVERSASHRKKSDQFQSIPAMVGEFSDEDALEKMLTENLLRQDVDPMEEAFAFGQLIKNGKSVEEVALKFGKSIRFIQDRCKLNSLIPELVVAIKEDKMSIAAAMIICKLDEEFQKKYYSQYQNNYNGLSKSTAESFVDNLFLTIAKSPWYKSDNQEDEEFEGGCSCKCSECQYNTANHGCLFWEMKAQDNGRCTDRAKFQSKLLAYMLHVVKENSENLVKKGQPLSFGKMVIGMDSGEYCSESAKSIRAAFKDAVDSLGYEVVNYTKAFDHKCWYDATDERTNEKLKSGEVYRVLALSGYDMPEISEAFYYVKKDDPSINSDEKGLPMQVKSLLNDIKMADQILSSSYAVAGSKAIVAHGKIDASDDVLAAELQLTASLMLKGCRALRLQYGLSETSNDAEVNKFIQENLDMKMFYQIMRGWIKRQLEYGYTIVVNEALNVATPYLDTLGENWCPTEYKKALDDAQAKHDKKKKKIAGQLQKLGYDENGNKIANAEAATPKTSWKDTISAQYKEMRRKHPEALLLFRAGDNYIALHEDASKVFSETLVGLEDVKIKGENVSVCKFPHQNIDTTLPKLVKAGHKVAICEQLEK